MVLVCECRSAHESANIHTLVVVFQNRNVDASVDHFVCKNGTMQTTGLGPTSNKAAKAIKRLSPSTKR